MRKLIIGLLLPIVALSFPLMAATPGDDVLAAIKSYRQALVKKDIAALETIWSSDYAFVNGHGQLKTKADRIAEMRSGHSSVESVTHEEDPKVTLHGDLALVLSRVTIVGKYSGREVSGQFRSLHVWSKVGGRWQLVFNQLTPIE
jgi:ketosteroid isomerase-like protein